MTDYKSQISQSEIIAKLEEMIGEPYELRGCVKFVARAFALCGIVLELDPDADPLRFLADARKFSRVSVPQFGDLAIFENIEGEEGYHVAFMVGRRWAFQSSRATNGVGRIEITRPEFAPFVRGFYRHEAMKVKAAVEAGIKPCS
jgi:hypothetical protein